MINEVTNTRSKMKKLERLIESTSFDGERSVAKKKIHRVKTESHQKLSKIFYYSFFNPVVQTNG